jgi:hypothetical protein
MEADVIESTTLPDSELGNPFRVEDTLCRAGHQADGGANDQPDW